MQGWQGSQGTGVTPRTVRAARVTGDRIASQGHSTTRQRDEHIQDAHASPPASGGPHVREPAHAAPRRRHGGGGCRCNASDAHHQWDKRRQRRQERRGRRGSARPLHVLAGLRRRSPPWGVQAAAGRSPSRQRTARPIVAQGGQSGTKRACICARHGARLQAPVNTHTDELGRVHALAAGHTFQGLKSHIGSVKRC